jgi:hypothetical protein
VSLAHKRQTATYLETTYGASERRVCRVLALARNTKRRVAARQASPHALCTVLGGVVDLDFMGSHRETKLIAINK